MLSYFSLHTLILENEKKNQLTAQLSITWKLFQFVQSNVHK